MISYKAFGVVMLVAAILGFRELINIKYGKKSSEIEIVKLIGYTSLFLIVLDDIFFKMDDKFLMMLPMLGMTIPIVFYNDSKRYNISDYFKDLIVVSYNEVESNVELQSVGMVTA